MQSMEERLRQASKNAFGNLQDTVSNRLVHAVSEPLLTACGRELDRGTSDGALCEALTVMIVNLIINSFNVAGANMQKRGNRDVVALEIRRKLLMTFDEVPPSTTVTVKREIVGQA